MRAGVAAVATLLALTACAGPSPRDDTSPPAPTVSRRGTEPTASPEATSTPTSPPTSTPTTAPVGPALARRLRSSHRPGCPVPLADLRLLRTRYVGFDGRTRTGQVVVHEDHAGAVARVFEELYDARWRIARMHLVDDYGGDDDRSMAANNTSAYNCRRVAGSPDWSEHAYGAAIDINPVQNPYVRDGSVSPPSGQRFATADRSRGAAARRGVIRAGDVVVRAFARIGWEWGGDWSSAKDYQHFSASGR